MSDVQYLAFAAADYQREHGRWPDHAELLAADPILRRLDRWQHEFRFFVTGDQFVVCCAGLDGVWGTADDVESDPVRATP